MMRNKRVNANRLQRRGVAIAALALLSSSSLIVSTALADHNGYTDAPADFVSVTDFFGVEGFNAIDSTNALQMAFNSGQNIFVPKMASNWITNGNSLTQDNQTILFEEGVVLEARAGQFMGTNDGLFRATNVENVRLEGYGATFRMRQADYANPALYTPAEWRHGIRLTSVTNFDVVGLTIENTGGDGIYVAGSQRVDSSSQNVTIQDVVIDNAYRNGISLIDVETSLIDNATVINTGGTAPQAGIVFEPNSSFEKINDVTVRNSIIENNGGDGIAWFLNNLADDGASTTGLIENVTVVGNAGDGLWISPRPLPNWEIRDSLLINQGDDGFDVERGPGTQTIEYSAFFGNADTNLRGDVVFGTGTFAIGGTPPDIFVNTTDPNDPGFYALVPSTTTLITQGASDGGFIGARGFVVVVPEPSTSVLLLAGLASFLLGPRRRSSNEG